MIVVEAVVVVVVLVLVVVVVIAWLWIVGRKYGYVKYASSESAHRAVDVLHGAMVCGNRLKVMIAEKPRYPDASSYRGDKRKFTADYDDIDQFSKRVA